MKTPPAWLVALHRQFVKARSSRRSISPRNIPTVPFSRDWEDLLDAAGLHSAEDRAAAAREAEALERSDRLVLVRHRYRKFIQRVRLPFHAEPWLFALFHSVDAGTLLTHSMMVMGHNIAEPHPLHPELWRSWCQWLLEQIACKKSARPFNWHRPEANRTLLALVRALTSREWPPHTLARDADVALQHPTKTIEHHRHSLERALTQMFTRPTTLEALNIITTNSSLLFDGPLTLHFADGTCDESRNLRHGDAVTAADLERAVRISTSATRLLSVENSKTSFRRLAELNTARDALIFTTSFPTRAVRLLLEKLPPDLPHWHFGDTDPAGYHILLKLRQLTPRAVQAWDMEWRDQPGSPPLSPYDQRTLTTLLSSSEMADLRDSLLLMQTANCRGAFEQEARTPAVPPAPGPATLSAVSP